MSSNLDKAILKIADAVADAKKASKEAKELASQPVTAAVGEEGTLKINENDTGLKLITPSNVSKAVSNALGGADVANNIAKEQARFEAKQQEANMKIAIERGVYYLEDALDDDMRAKVLSGMFAQKENKLSREEASAVSRKLTEFIAKIPDGSYLTARNGSAFAVDKNIGYMPDVFGADGRAVTVGGMKLTIDGAQPCIYIKGKNFLFVDFRGVTFVVESFGVNVFEMDGGTGNTIIHGGIIRSRRYLEKGYVGGRQGLFAPIDGWTPENPDVGYGYADKGLYDLGFNTTTLMHDLARYRNNAAQVQNVKKPADLTWAQVKEHERNQSVRKYLSVGGYWNADGTKNQFPQEDGTVSEEWGMWAGGQRGSSANGWVFYDVHHMTVWDFDIRGMTGSALQFGLYSTRDCRAVDGGDIDTAIRERMVCYDCKVYGGFMDANYIGGIGVVRGVGITIEGMNCIEGKVGHPDASLGHSRDNSQVTVDPGYWLWTSRYLPQIGIRFLNNHFGFAARKVCDAHTGNNIQIIGNSGKCLYYGTGVVIEETFAMDSTKGGRSESTSFEYQESNIVIKDNEFICGLNGIFLINGATGVKARKDKNLWWLRANITVQNNRIYAPRGIPCNFGHNRFTISDNSCTFALPFGEPFGLRYLSAINIKKGGQNYSPDTKIVIAGGGDGARGGAATCTVTNGVITAIRITATGTKYSDAKSISVQAVDPTGQGSGAEFEAFCNAASYAYMIGAEARYGTIDASYIANNTARNSPHGNYDRQFLSANLTGCTVRDNRLDITPYTKGTNPALPYVSDRDYVHRSGVVSQGFYQTGTHTDCRHDNNKTWNQVTGIYADHVFRNTETASGTSAGSSSVSRSDVDVLIQNAVAAAIAPIKAKLEAAPSGGGGGATGQPASPSPDVATPAAPSNIKFSLANAEINALEASADAGTAKLISVVTSVKAGDPDGWTGAVAEEDGKKVIKAVAGENGKGHRYLETSGVSATSNTQTALVMPFKVVRGGSDGGAFIVLPMIGGSPAVGSMVATHGAEGFTLRVPDDSTVDGKVVRATDVFAYNKWHVAKIQISAAFDKIRFGTSHVANTGRSITIGAGFEILQGDVSKAAEKAAALMTAYSVAAV